MVKKSLIGLLAVFIIIQFFRPLKNVSTAATPDDIFNHYAAPDSIKSLLLTSCYDCHSNNTSYPWYAEIQPLAWWLSHHIEEGKGELNFSDFEAFNVRFKSHKLNEVIELVKNEEMPLKSYLISHSEARLSPAQRLGIIKWADQVRNTIKPRE
jgi:hypothetical protein